jgi:hypothetical protein
LNWGRKRCGLSPRYSRSPNVRAEVVEGELDQARRTSKLVDRFTGLPTQWHEVFTAAGEAPRTDPAELNLHHDPLVIGLARQFLSFDKDTGPVLHSLTVKHCKGLLPRINAPLQLNDGDLPGKLVSGSPGRIEGK